VNDVIEQLEGKTTTNEEKNMEWGVGLVQRKEKMDKKLDDAYEMSKPFARDANDEDLNNMLKEKVRWGDPLAPMLQDKKQKKDKKKKKEKKGLGITTERRWAGLGPANRFNIAPGNLWDGIDRSNGFEARLLKRANEKRDKEEQEFMSTISDM
jgi:pre-mRNA-splicing factor CWC26